MDSPVPALGIKFIRRIFAQYIRRLTVKLMCSRTENLMLLKSLVLVYWKYFQLAPGVDRLHLI